MIKQVLLSFAVAALSVASAATHKIALIDTSVAKGQELKAGNYRMEIKDSSVVIGSGKQSVELPVKVDNTNAKFPRTRVLYNQSEGKYSIQAIEVGGTTTKVTFDSGVRAGGK